MLNYARHNEGILPDRLSSSSTCAEWGPAGPPNIRVFYNLQHRQTARFDQWRRLSFIHTIQNVHTNVICHHLFNPLIRTPANSSMGSRCEWQGQWKRKRTPLLDESHQHPLVEAHAAPQTTAGSMRNCCEYPPQASLQHFNQLICRFIVFAYADINTV